MEQITIADIKLVELSNGTKEIRLLWSNERKHAITIKAPFGQKQVSRALHNASVFALLDKKIES